MPFSFEISKNIMAKEIGPLTQHNKHHLMTNYAYENENIVLGIKYMKRVVNM